MLVRLLIGLRLLLVRLLVGLCLLLVRLCLLHRSLIGLRLLHRFLIGLCLLHRLLIGLLHGRLQHIHQFRHLAGRLPIFHCLAPHLRVDRQSVIEQFRNLKGAGWLAVLGNVVFHNYIVIGDYPFVRP